MSNQLRFRVAGSVGAADQAIFALAHFLLVARIGRSGGTAELGSFAFYYAFIVLANALHGALVSEPYNVATRGATHAKQWLILSTLGLVAFCGVLSLGLFLLGYIASWSTAVLLLGALISCAWMWSVKAWAIQCGKYAELLSGAILYCGALALSMSGEGSASERGLWGIALGGGIAGAVIMMCARAWSRSALLEDISSRRDGSSAPISYARWSLLSALIIWFINNGPFLLMPLFGALDEAAGLRAIVNLLVPLNVLIVGASAGALPLFAKMRGLESPRVYRATVLKLLVAAVLGGIIFSSIVALWSGKLLQLVYGHAFRRFEDSLLIAALMPPLWCASAVFRTALRAVQLSRDVFLGYFLPMFPLGTLALVVAARQGAREAALSMLLVHSLIVGFLCWRFVLNTRVVR